jgi:hypothetical protein
VWYAGVDTAERDACHRARTETIAEAVHILEVQAGLRSDI